MKSIHLVIPDLFLPKAIAAEACADMLLPALEKLLARGVLAKPLVLSPSTSSGQALHGGVERSDRADALWPPLENHLCELFGMSCAEDAPVAPISAEFDGLATGFWLRADPVHLHLQRDQMLLASVQPSSEEASALCASLNAHFSGQGMEFFAPHPQRWYVRLDALPQFRARPLSQVIGGDVRRSLPTGADAARWHQLFNEIQMLLFAHPLNEAREARGELSINSVWFWGGGCGVNETLQKSYDIVSSGEVLVEMFAAAADVPFLAWPEQWHEQGFYGKQLLVWTGLRLALQRGDLAAWRTALQDFENGYAQPIWKALRTGRVAQMQLDVLGEHGILRIMLKRGDCWAVWRRTKRLAEYSLT